MLSLGWVLTGFIRQEGILLVRRGMVHPICNFLHFSGLGGFYFFFFLFLNYNFFYSILVLFEDKLDGLAVIVVVVAVGYGKLVW